MMPLTVYTAASYRHLHAVRLFHRLLRANADIFILDWTAQPLPSSDFSPARRREWMDSDPSGQAFAFCRDACANADVVVYLGESGQDAGVEVGMAYAFGTPVLGVRGPLEAPGLMLHGAVSLWTDSVQEAVHALTHADAILRNGDALDELPEHFLETRLIRAILEGRWEK